jgi:hypothetical protein
VECAPPTGLDGQGFQQFGEAGLVQAFIRHQEDDSRRPLARHILDLTDERDCAVGIGSWIDTSMYPDRRVNPTQECKRAGWVAVGQGLCAVGTYNLPPIAVEGD